MASVVLTLLVMALCSAAQAGTIRDPYEALTEIGLGNDLKQGYALRADTWSGDLPADGSKRIEYTLFRGNGYRFYAYSSTKGAKISFHVQDHDGANVETGCWQKEKDEFYFAGAELSPKSTGSYYLVVKVEQSPTERTEWSLVYAYK